MSLRCVEYSSAYFGKLYVKGNSYLQGSGPLGGEARKTGGFGIDQSCTYEYKIYVQKNEYERAKRLVSL